MKTTVGISVLMSGLWQTFSSQEPPLLTSLAGLSKCKIFMLGANVTVFVLLVMMKTIQIPWIRKK